MKPNRKYCVSEEDPGETETSAVEDEEQQQVGMEESTTEMEDHLKTKKAKTDSIK